MISLKEHVIQQSEATLAAALRIYAGLVRAATASASFASPAFDSPMAEQLQQLSHSLRNTTPPSEIDKAGQEIERAWEAWGARADEFNTRRADELRELVLGVAEATAAASERAQVHRDGLRALSVELKGLAGLEDLSEVRRLVCKTAIALTVAADRMAEENQRSVAALRSQVAAYEERLQRAETRADTDPLTGLLNRAGATRAIEARIAARQPFCLILADLNHFKQLNDRYGHLVGDQVLKCFAEELRSNFRAADKIARWGGDEFVIILGATEAELESRLATLRRWALGDYKMDVDGKRLTILVGAAIGGAAWRQGWTADELFARADAAMYADKTRRAASSASR